jgi:hypothetical protein
MVFQMFGVKWVMPIRVVDLLVCWKRRVVRNDINIVRNAIPSFLMWCIWRERVARSFNRERESLDLWTCFLNSYLSGSLLLPFSMSLAMQIFVLFFLVHDLHGVFSHILSMYLGCTPYALNKFHFTL